MQAPAGAALELKSAAERDVAGAERDVARPELAAPADVPVAQVRHRTARMPSAREPVPNMPAAADVAVALENGSEPHANGNRDHAPVRADQDVQYPPPAAADIKRHDPVPMNRVITETKMPAPLTRPIQV